MYCLSTPLDIKWAVYYKGNMDTQKQADMKSLHLKLPVEVLAGVQELAREKTVAPSTYIRMVVVQHISTQKKRRESGK